MVNVLDLPEARRFKHTYTTASLASLGVVKNCGNVDRAILIRYCHWRPCSFLDCPESAVCLPYEYHQDEKEPQTLDLLFVSSQMFLAWLIFKDKAGRSNSALWANYYDKRTAIAWHQEASEDLWEVGLWWTKDIVRESRTWFSLWAGIIVGVGLRTDYICALSTKKFSWPGIYPSEIIFTRKSYYRCIIRTMPWIHYCCYIVESRGYRLD